LINIAAADVRLPSKLLWMGDSGDAHLNVELTIIEAANNRSASTSINDEKSNSRTVTGDHGTNDG